MHLDTTAMLELMRRPPDDALVAQLRARMGDEALFWSSVQYGELADVGRRDGDSVEDLADRVARVVEEIPVHRDIALLASALKSEARRTRAGRNFSLIDGIVLATARSLGQRLLTTAREFSPFPDAVVVR